MLSTFTSLTRRLLSSQTSLNPTPKAFKALIIGSEGHLGSTISQTLANYYEESTIIKTDVSSKSQLPLRHSFDLQGLHENLKRIKETEFDLIVCAAGGWGPQPSLDGLIIDDDNDAIGDYTSHMNLMLQQNLHPVILTSSVLPYLDDDGGLCVVIGAAAALYPTPGMEGYGLAKAAVHHTVQSFAKSRRSSKAQQHILGLCPTIIDTPANRESQPHADTSGWVKAEEIASQIVQWMDEPYLRPETGSLLRLNNNSNGSASLTIVRQ